MVHGPVLFLAGMCAIAVAGIWRGNNHESVPKPRKWWLQWVDLIPGIGKRRPRAVNPKTGKLYPRAVRTTVTMSALAGGFMLLAFVPWQDAVVTWTYTGWGPGFLAILLLGLASLLYWEAHHQHGYHQVATMLSAFMFGTMLVDAWVLRGRLGRKGKNLIPETGAAMNSFTRRATSGKALHTFHHSASIAGIPWIDIAGIAAVIIALVLILNLHRGVPHLARKAKEYSDRTSELTAAGARPALTAGDSARPAAARGERAGYEMGRGR